MSLTVEEILADIASNKIKVDSEIRCVLPASPERYLSQYGDTFLNPHE